MGEQEERSAHIPGKQADSDGGAGEVLELHVDTSTLVARSGANVQPLHLVNLQRLALFALLVKARRAGDSDGWVYSHDIASLPGWQRCSRDSVGKRVFDLLGASPLARRIIACGRGQTSGPWRLHAAPENIRVVDPDNLERLLTQGAVPGAQRISATRSNDALDTTALHEGGEAVARGVALHLVGALLEPFLTAADADVRATAAFIEGQRLLKLGRVRAAGHHAAAALSYFSDAGRGRRVERATALNIAGCIAYREREFGQALAHAGQELEVLRSIDDVAPRGRGIARCMRRVAFTTARLEDWTTARRAAAEAEAHATEGQDQNLLLLSRLAAARIRALDGSPREAAARFEVLLGTVPAGCPAALVQGRRFHCEALYLAGNQTTADALALSVVADASYLSLVRESVATLRLLEFHGRNDVLASIPPNLRSVRRDRVVDADLLARATARAASLK